MATVQLLHLFLNLQFPLLWRFRRNMLKVLAQPCEQGLFIGPVSLCFLAALDKHAAVPEQDMG